MQEGRRFLRHRQKHLVPTCIFLNCTEKRKWRARNCYVRSGLETSDKLLCTKIMIYINITYFRKYCHALGDRRRGIGLTIAFIGSRYNYSYSVSQCTPFKTVQ
jgi:hypothetical protein